MCCSLGLLPSVFIELETAEGALFLWKMSLSLPCFPGLSVVYLYGPWSNDFWFILTKWWLCGSRHDTYNAKNQILRAYDFNSWFNVSPNIHIEFISKC